jgi:hypothetical protein
MEYYLKLRGGNSVLDIASTTLSAINSDTFNIVLDGLFYENGSTYPVICASNTSISGLQFISSSLSVTNINSVRIGYTNTTYDLNTTVDLSVRRTIEISASNSLITIRVDGNIVVSNIPFQTDSVNSLLRLGNTSNGSALCDLYGFSITKNGVLLNDWQPSLSAATGDILFDSTGNSNILILNSIPSDDSKWVLGAFDLDVLNWPKRAEITKRSPSSSINSFTAVVTEKDLPGEIFDLAEQSDVYLKVNPNNTSANIFIDTGLSSPLANQKVEVKYKIGFDEPVFDYPGVFSNARLITVGDTSKGFEWGTSCTIQDSAPYIRFAEHNNILENSTITSSDVYEISVVREPNAADITLTELTRNEGGIFAVEDYTNSVFGAPVTLSLGGDFSGRSRNFNFYYCEIYYDDVLVSRISAGDFDANNVALIDSVSNTSFPLPQPAYSASSLRSTNTGSDIRLCLNRDGTGQLPIEIAEFNTVTRKATIWTRFDELSNGKSFWIFYGNIGITGFKPWDTYGENNVWQDSVLRSGPILEEIDSTATYAPSVTGNVTVTDGKFTLGAYIENGVVTYPSEVVSSRNFSISLWVRTQDSNSTGYIFTDGANVNNIFAEFLPDGISSSIGTGTTVVSSDFNGLIVKQEYNHYAFTHSNDGTYSIYVNGNLVGFGLSSPFTSLSENLSIGNNTALSRDLIGSISDLDVRNYTKSDVQILEEYKNQSDPASFWVSSTPESTSLTGIQLSEFLRRFELEGIAPSNSVEGLPVLITEDNLPSEFWDITESGENYLQFGAGSGIRIEKETRSTNVAYIFDLKINTSDLVFTTSQASSVYTFIQLSINSNGSFRVTSLLDGTSYDITSSTGLFTAGEKITVDFRLSFDTQTSYELYLNNILVLNSANIGNVLDPQWNLINAWHLNALSTSNGSLTYSISDADLYRLNVYTVSGGLLNNLLKDYDPAVSTNQTLVDVAGNANIALTAFPGFEQQQYLFQSEGGGDLRICENRDGTRRLPIDIVKFNTINRTAEIWVRFPTYSTIDRNIWLFYGREGSVQPLPNAQYGKYEVWQERYQRFNLDETSGVIASSSTGTNDATFNLPLPRLGPNQGQLFIPESGDSGVINLGSNDNLNTSQFTFSATIRPNSSLLNRQILSSDNSVAITDRFWQWFLTDTNFISIIVWSGSSIIIQETGTISLTDNVTHKVDFVYDGSAYKTYVNGVLDINQTDSRLMSVGGIGNTDYYLGSRGFQDGSNPGSEDDFAGEVFDAEILSGISKPIEYIEVESANILSPSTFWSVNSAPEDAFDRTPPVITVSGDPITFIGQFGSFTPFTFSATDDFDDDAEITSRVVITGEELVNTNVVGSYIIRYNVSDIVGNQAQEVIRTVVITDITPPELIVEFENNPVIVREFGSPKPIINALATDDIDDDAEITSRIQVTGYDDVNMNVIGSYEVRFDVSDLAGNQAPTQIRTIQVIDTIGPNLTILPQTTQTIRQFESPPEWIIIANDDYDGAIATSEVIIGGNLNVNVAGTYTVTFIVADSSGNFSEEISREVIVLDAQAPTITVFGNEPTVINEGDTLAEFGYEAFDNIDGNITANVSVSGFNEIDTNQVGEYQVIYSVTDSAGNVGVTIRTVIIRDVTKPTLEVNGKETTIIREGSTFVPFIPTAFDDVDGDISANVIVGGDTVNTTVPGTYILTFNVSDSANNAADEVVRTVIVRDRSVPIITLPPEFGDVVNIDEGDPIPDFNAQAFDEEDGDITNDIVVDGLSLVDVNTPNSYPITFTVSDSDGNQSDPITLTLIVNDITQPEFFVISGQNPVNVEQFGNIPPFELGAFDNVDNIISDRIQESGLNDINTDIVGTYEVLYSVTDVAGNSAQYIRIVNVLDVTRPTLTVTPTTNIIEVFAKEDEPQFVATAIDEVDGDISDRVVVTGFVDMNTPGVYILQFDVTDRSGNAAFPSVLRAVRVLESPVQTIVTSQAPDAKPVATSIVVGEDWDVLISVPNYEVPELIFGGSTTVETGVGEVISPLMCCNITANTETVDVEVYRLAEDTRYGFVSGLAIPGFDTIPIPMNGQFFKSGDLLEIRSSANGSIHAIISYTLGQSEEDDV